ncbi:MAG TPA: PKD domain-containing protein [Candidatus Binataceae bacterium]|nr:PKD domain-containing protein [Candidatus Binataceae bacterium]
MADARLASAAATAALAVLLLIATLPAPAFAQQRQNQDPQEQQMQPPGTMQGPGSMSEPMPESTTNGRGLSRVDIPQPPLITMTAVPGYGPAPLSVGFFVNTVDPEGKGFVSYVWNFGDGQVSMDPPLTFFHTYTVAGSYVATVSATTADGRTAIAYVGVTVRPGILN